MTVTSLEQVINVYTFDDETVNVSTVFSSGQKSIQFQDEGVNVGTAGSVSVVNFVGSSVTVTQSGSTLTVTLTGGGSGSGDFVGPASSVSGNLVSFGNTSGKLGADSGLAKDATGGLAGLTLFKINFKNALNTFISFFTNSNTAARTYTFMDRDGTIMDGYNQIVTGTTNNRRHCGSIGTVNLTTGVLTINSLRAMPVQIKQTITIDILGLEVSTGTTGKMRLIIYADNGAGYPGAKVVESGEQTVTTPAVYEGITGVSSVTLLPGLYWFVYFTDTANTVRAYSTQTPNVFGLPSTVGTNFGGHWSSALTYTSGALPDPYPAGGSIITIGGTQAAIHYRAI